MLFGPQTQAQKNESTYFGFSLSRFNETDIIDIEI